MGKRSRQTRSPQGLDLLRQDVTRLTARWFPKGAAVLEKQAGQATKELQKFRQRRQQLTAQKPRRARLLWLLPLPLIPATVIALASGQFSAFMANAVSSGLFLTGAMLAYHGFQQEAKQRLERFQTTGRVPFRTLSASTVALATSLTAWAGAGHNLPIALAFGTGAFAAFALLYGLDPRRQPVVAKNQNGNSQRVTKALQQAEQKIIAIEQASSRLSQPELNQRLTRIVALAREILAEIARDPDDLRRARKFLNTYLDGAQRVVTGYAKAHTHGQTHPLEANFRRILVTIEEVFGQQYQRLLENDLRDLDIQMEVLETQIKHEGLN